MARPKQSDGPAADVRIEAAFFAALQEMPFQKITISGIVKRAGVNRNSFYYHYTNLDDLAHSAVERLLIPEVPRLLARGLVLESDELDRIFTDAGALERLSWMIAIMGPHSNSDLRGILRDAVLGAWLEAFSLSLEDLDLRTAATVHFILGGMFELLSGIDTRDVLSDLSEIRRLPVVQTSAKMMIEAFTDLANTTELNLP